MKFEIIDKVINELRENKEDSEHFELKSNFEHFELESKLNVNSSESEHKCSDMQPSANHPERFPLDCEHLRYLDEWTCIKGDYPYKQCPLCENCKFSFTI